NARLGIEQTKWKRENIDIEAAINRKPFAVPRQRIIDIAQYKAAQHGSFEPDVISGIAPSRDCGSCGQRFEESRISLLRMTSCFHCSMLGRQHKLSVAAGIKGEEKMTCTSC